MLYSIKQKQKSEKEKLYYEKKLFTIALSAIIVIAMAVPAFAGTIKNGNYFMNLYGSEGALLQGREVSLYSSGSSKDQQFALYLYNGQYVIVNTQNYSYALNRKTSNGTCITWSLSTGFEDSKLSRYGSIIELTNYQGSDLLAPDRVQHARLLWGGVSGYDTWSWA